MTSLKDLLVSTNFDAAVKDMSAFIEETVSKQSGITGIALKGAMAAATKVDSDIVTKGSRRLLPEMADSLDGLWQDYKANGGATDFGAHLEANSSSALDAILNVADRNANNINVPGLDKVYKGVRGKAAKVIEQELPKIGQLIEKHAQ
ncbi:hypothetical protein N24_0007 [Corynebacterium suranareeae]|uniref:Uncharacterized protein n=1 Tax=Corynebacterium suranareeae TaxID=2506452 RepID=A0A160PKX4_9CORY|nr:hypothetical protein [Corynebacterium suranareeae]BAU94269.1 hypothetical protein N24_0007 [Corynebacterium suranareeae]